MRVSYILNQYPKVSHTFIKREIFALERLGFIVQRISMRGWNESQIDVQDVKEQSTTQYVLKCGVLALLFSTLRVLLENLWFF